MIRMLELPELDETTVAPGSATVKAKIEQLLRRFSEDQKRLEEARAVNAEIVRERDTARAAQQSAAEELERKSISATQLQLRLEAEMEQQDFLRKPVVKPGYIYGCIKSLR